LHSRNQTKDDRMNAARVFRTILTLGTLSASFLQQTMAGPAAYGICQAGCAAVVVACYAAGGFVFGTVTAGAATPAIILGCNSAYGTCQGACWAALIAPTP